MTGELADRNETLFSLWRRVRLEGRGESMIMASIVDEVDTPECLRISSESARSAGRSPDGQPICSRNCSIEGLAPGPGESWTRSFKLLSRVRGTSRLS